MPNKRTIKLLRSIEGASDTHCCDCPRFDEYAALDGADRCPWSYKLKWTDGPEDCQRPKECLEAEVKEDSTSTPEIIEVGSGPPKRSAVDIVANPMEMPKWKPIDKKCGTCHYWPYERGWGACTHPTPAGLTVEKFSKKLMSSVCGTTCQCWKEKQ